MRIQEKFQLQYIDDWKVHFYVLGANCRSVLRQFDFDLSEAETVVEGVGHLDQERATQLLLQSLPNRYHATVTANYNHDGKLRVAIVTSPECTKAGFGLSLLLTLGEIFSSFSFVNAPIATKKMTSGELLWSIILDAPQGLDVNQCLALSNRQVERIESWIKVNEDRGLTTILKRELDNSLRSCMTLLENIDSKLEPLNSLGTEFASQEALLSAISAELEDTKKLVSDGQTDCESNFGEIRSLLLELGNVLTNIKNLVDNIKSDTSIVISGNETNITEITENFTKIREKIDQLRRVDFESLKETVIGNNAETLGEVKERILSLSDTLISAFDGTANSLLRSDSDLAKSVEDANLALQSAVHAKLEEAKAAITAVGTSITASVTNLLNIVTSAYKSWLSEAETIADKETYLTVALQNFRDNFQTVQSFTETFKEFLNELNSFSNDLDSVASLEASILSRVPALTKLDELLTNKSKIESGRLALDVVKTIDDVKRTFTKEKKLVL